MILYDAWNNFHNFNLAEFYVEQMLRGIYLILILNYNYSCAHRFFFEETEIILLTLINYLQLNLNWKIFLQHDC